MSGKVTDSSSFSTLFPHFSPIFLLCELRFLTWLGFLGVRYRGGGRKSFDRFCNERSFDLEVCLEAEALFIWLALCRPLPSPLLHWTRLNASPKTLSYIPANQSAAVRRVTGYPLRLHLRWSNQLSLTARPPLVHKKYVSPFALRAGSLNLVHLAQLHFEVL